jgi:hypothetical protein
LAEPFSITRNLRDQHIKDIERIIQGKVSKDFTKATKMPVRLSSDILA